MPINTPINQSGNCKLESTTVNYNTLINKQTRRLFHRHPHTPFWPYHRNFLCYFFSSLVQLFIARLTLANLSSVVVRCESGYYTNHRHTVLLLGTLISPWVMQSPRLSETVPMLTCQFRLIFYMVHLLIWEWAVKILNNNVPDKSETPPA